MSQPLSLSLSLSQSLSLSLSLSQTTVHRRDVTYTWDAALSSDKEFTLNLAPKKFVNTQRSTFPNVYFTSWQFTKQAILGCYFKHCTRLLAWGLDGTDLERRLFRVSRMVNCLGFFSPAKNGCLGLFRSCHITQKLWLCFVPVLWPTLYSTCRNPHSRIKLIEQWNISKLCEN